MPAAQADQNLNRRVLTIQTLSMPIIIKENKCAY